MEQYEFYQNIRLKNKKVKDSFSLLNNLYNKLPKTKGCLENINKKECCGSYCCHFQTPQLLYCEFLYIWDHLKQKISDNDLCELFRKCMLNSINNSPSKGCIFFDKSKKNCSIHKFRPINCYLYGITPTEEFDRRYRRLKEQYKNNIDSFIRPQCKLVSTVNGEEVSSEDIDKWWKEINKIEKSIGINKNKINDELGGSYRAPHDHILLYNMPDNILNGLAGIRLYDNWVDKIIAIDEIVNILKNHFKKLEKVK